MENETRKLASIQIVKEISPISNYDRVELAVILGWSCIVGKNQFKPGDKCVYFEPDSQLYPHEIWDSFLAPRKYKIKTIKMCKVISQGLIIPLPDLYKLNPSLLNTELVEGMDLTNILKVTHTQDTDKVYEENETSGKGKSRCTIKKFPTYLISKTDETNIQNIPYIFSSMNGMRFYVSEKLEGQSSTYILTPSKVWWKRLFKLKEYKVCSRERELNLPLKFLNKEKLNNWHYISFKYDIYNKLLKYYKKYGIYLAIQGEIIGPSIQGNIYNLNDYELYLYNIKNLNNGKFVNYKTFIKICCELNIPHVPILDDNLIIDNSIMNSNYMLNLSEGYSTLKSDQIREGIVVRNVEDPRISFKAVSLTYLEKYKR